MKYIEVQHHDFVSIIGEDANSFLQGQLSCNMSLLNESTSIVGALCNLKGRVVADFKAYQIDDAIILQTDAGMGQTIIDILAKYAVFSKVTITLASLSEQVTVFFGDDCFKQLTATFNWNSRQKAAVSRQNDVLLIELSDSPEQVQIIALSDEAQEQVQALRLSAEQASQDEWERLDIEAGVIHVNKQMSEEFTPQLLNYDLSGVIDFKKGCYTGQEVVARMFYRSKAKKRLFLLSSSLPISAQDELKYTEKELEQTAQILRFSNGEASNLILAVLPTSLEETAQLPSLTNNIDSSLQFLTMPYTE